MRRKKEPDDGLSTAKKDYGLWVKKGN